MSLELKIAELIASASALGLSATVQFGASQIASSAGSVLTTETKNSDREATAPEKTGTQDAPGPIYWCHKTDGAKFGMAADEEELKKLKKATPAIIKTTKAKYDKLVEAASVVEEETSAVDEETAESDVNERVRAILDDLPTEPSAEEVQRVFLRYLPKDLEAGDERKKRISLIKPILASVGAAKAGEIAEDKRYGAIVELTKVLEAHLEETGQVTDEDDMV